MKRILLALFTLLVIPAVALCQGPVRFADYFIDSTLRIDYYHIGNAAEELITIDRIYQQGIWAGNPRHLIDPFGRGRYRVRVFDLVSETLIYSKGYDSYFGDYRTGKAAKEGVRRTYHETVLIPYPVKLIRVVFEGRDQMNLYHPILTYDVDPADYHVIREAPQRGDQIYEQTKNGSPHDKVDIVVIAEGYTIDEKLKFEQDLKRYTDIFFGMEPYKALYNRFNICGIFTASPQSGVDEPRQGSYRKTALGASFNSLDSDRYLLVEDNKTMRDIASQVPYDVIMVMVNSKRYGGGGFYGCFSDFTSDGGWADYVFHHEFGHAFAGLADEYYSVDAPEDAFYAPGVEPSEPNITALLDRGELKWKDLVSPGLSIPTEWGQQVFDSLTAAQRTLGKEHADRVEQMRRAGASGEDSAKETESFRAASKKLSDGIIQFMEQHPLRGKVGAFQGGGYLPKGFYRPTVNSMMNQFNKSDRSFYPVNEHAIREVIDFFSE